jgi:hypothetical protein
LGGVGRLSGWVPSRFLPQGCEADARAAPALTHRRLLGVAASRSSSRPARATVGELEAAMDRALAHDGPCLIEVPIDPHHCSEELREWGSRVAVVNGRAPLRTTSSFEAV